MLVEPLEGRHLMVGDVLDLSELAGSNGFRILGIDANDQSGFAVASAGDVNGDGFDDLVIGARLAEDSTGGVSEGESYVVFGKSGGFGASLDLSTLDGTNGFRIAGIDSLDESGRSVSGIGDFNGDGFDDLIVGAYRAEDSAASTGEGESYVLFGKSAGFTALLDLSLINGTNGFRITGIDANDQSGFAVSRAGDVNGDGFDDLIIGAPFAEDPEGSSAEGEVYVLYGRSSGLGAVVDLNTISIFAGNGFVVSGIAGGDNLGFSVSGASDFNGDGLDDLFVGTPKVRDSLLAVGASYVMFGASISLRILGIDSNDQSGFSVSGAGDINGDGFDDLIIGAPQAEDPSGGAGEGESYVVFGKPSGFGGTLDLSTLDGTNGFRINGIDAGDQTGFSVGGAGDFNGDGFDDLIIGANLAEGATGAADEGESYVLFGKSSGFGASLDLSTLNGLNGIRITGIDAGDQSGISVSGAGDVNGDGFDDLIIGAAFAEEPGGAPDEGASYVVFGGNFNGGAEKQQGGSTADTLTATQGASAIDILVGGGGNDILISDGGADVLRAGEGDDVLAIPNVDFSGGRRLLGGNGNDTLRLDGIGLKLDLTTIADNRIIDIEAIDLGNARSHEVALTVREVLNLSSHSNTLTLRGSGSLVRILDGGWFAPKYVVIGETVFRQYSDGAATLNIQISLTAIAPLIDLRGISGENGVRIGGGDVNDNSGFAVSSAGDVNGDGFDDLIVSAPSADDPVSFFNSKEGESYVVFGKPDDFSPLLALKTLNGVNGFRLMGIDTDDYSGWSVSGAGDINGDGFDDLVIGARFGEDSTESRTSNRGESYLVFGKASGFDPVLDLGKLDGNNGFRIRGVDSRDQSGWSVSDGGDINGDGLDDLIIGAYRGEAPPNSFYSDNGESYVAFGKPGGFDAVLNLNALDGTNGFHIQGIKANDQFGFSVSGAGDINGDGFDDVIIGANLAEDPAGASSEGESYVVFGKSGGFSASLNLAALNGTNGFRISGIDANDNSGWSVSGAGDINGDGFDDLIIGAPFAEDLGGESYLVYGKPTGFGVALDLSTLNGTNGFRVTGVDAGDNLGFAVSGAGDINGDGFDDLILGARFAEDTSGSTDEGTTYLVFGKSNGFGAKLDLSSLDGRTGLRITGDSSLDISGSSVSSAGDVNGDGFDDLIIGARQAEVLGQHSYDADDEGASYLIFGGYFTGGVETQVGTNATDTLMAKQGATAVDILIGGRGHDLLISDGGDDVLRGGEGNDVLAVPDANFSGSRRLIGGSGSDTLRLVGGGIHLDLTTIPDNRIVDVEIIDITGNGNNTLTLNQREVLNLSSTTNTLVVRRNSSDTLNFGSGWTQAANETIGTETFEVFMQDQAILKITTSSEVTRGVTVSPVSGNTTEAGGNTTFSVVLTSQPTANVTIPLLSSDTSEGTVPVNLIFTPDNWNIAQTVTVTGVDDNVVDGDVAFSIVIGIASGGDYEGIDPADILVTNTDDDVAALSLTLADASISENGGTTTGTVARNTSTNTELIVELVNSQASQATIPTTLVIPVGALSATFEVTAINDQIFVGNRSLTVSARATGWLSASRDLQLVDDDFQSAWHNSVNPVDVNDDGTVTPIDALLVINILNSGGAGVLPPVRPVDPEPAPYLDVSRDGSVSPIDALLVINRLNAMVGGGEGESPPLDSLDELVFGDIEWLNNQFTIAKKRHWAVGYPNRGTVRLP